MPYTATWANSIAQRPITSYTDVVATKRGASVKIVIDENPERSETEVVIHCKTADDEVLRMMAALHAADKKLSGVKDGKTYLIDLSDVMYFDTVDKKSFIYTAKDVYETTLKLYELEQVSANRFFRSSKSTVLNIAKIKSIMPDFGGRLEVILQSGEKLAVSRQYANQLKIKLGI